MPNPLFANINSAIGQARLAVRVRSMLGVEEDPNLKVGINGFGRIGRLVCKMIQETAGIDVVAINDPYIDADYMAYMLLHGSSNVAGPYCGDVLAENGQLLLDGRPGTVYAQREPEKTNWVAAGARYVIDCSGLHDTLRKASGHLKGGAHKVLVAAPCAHAPTFVMGANHKARTLAPAPASSRHAPLPHSAGGAGPLHSGLAARLTRRRRR